jgi:hypothetical protein
MRMNYVRHDIFVFPSFHILGSSAVALAVSGFRALFGVLGTGLQPRWAEMQTLERFARERIKSTALLHCFSFRTAAGQLVVSVLERSVYILSFCADLRTWPLIRPVRISLRWVLISPPRIYHPA